MARLATRTKEFLSPASHSGLTVHGASNKMMAKALPCSCPTSQPERSAPFGGWGQEAVGEWVFAGSFNGVVNHGGVCLGLPLLRQSE